MTLRLFASGRAHPTRPKFPGSEETILTKGTLRQVAPDIAGADAPAVETSLHPGSRAELKQLSDNALLAQVRALPLDNDLRGAAWLPKCRAPPPGPPQAVNPRAASPIARAPTVTLRDL